MGGSRWTGEEEETEKNGPGNVASQGKFYKHEKSEESNESSSSSDINSEEEHLDHEDDRQCKNDEVNTEPTTSMSLLENSEARQSHISSQNKILLFWVVPPLNRINWG